MKEKLVMIMGAVLISLSLEAVLPTYATADGKTSTGEKTATSDKNQTSGKTSTGEVK